MRNPKLLLVGGAVASLLIWGSGPIHASATGISGASGDLAADVNAGEAGQHATANDVEKCAEGNVDDGQVEDDDSQDNNGDQSEASANDQSTTDTGDEDVSSEAADSSSAADAGSSSSTSSSDSGSSSSANQ
jgi:hypothetical protein